MCGRGETLSDAVIHLALTQRVHQCNADRGLRRRRKDVHSSIGRVTRTDTAMERGNARGQAASTVLYSQPQTAIREVVSTMRLEGKVALMSGSARGVANR